MRRIPFNKPSFMGSELAYIEQAVRGGHISGDGPFSRRCEELLREETGAARVLLTTSCTHALELSALLAGIEPGHDVIVPSFTFVSTANAFTLHGARPIFCDVDPETLNLDPRHLERLLTPKTRAVVPVHYGGIGCEMDAIRERASSVGARVIEDNAHGLFGRWNGAPLGSFGALSTLSFHETKNFICGEGGAIVINDPDLVQRAEILREKGTNRTAFFRGEVDRYTWVDQGSSWLPSDLLAAFLLAQLEARDEILARRRRIHRRYARDLAGWAEEQGVRLPRVPAHCEPSWHMFYLRLPDQTRRDAFIAHLAEEGIKAVFHYVPLHLSRMGQRYGGRPGDCPESERAFETLVRLPLFDELSEEDQDFVIERVTSFRC